jgi:ParB-like chromosome segregation protein Spo0J
LRIETIPVGRIQPNTYNPNHMKPEERKALSAMFERIGYVQPILVREIEPGLFEIIDGEHRYDELKARGIEQAEVVIVDTDPETAKLATLAMNQIKGRPIPILLAKVMLDLERDLGTDALKAAGFGDKDIKKAHELAGPPGDPLAAKPEKLEEPRSFSVTLVPEAYETVMAAIARAKEIGETDSDAVALLTLAQEFLSTYPEDGDE